jgi:hypothetical protein
LLIQEEIVTTASDGGDLANEVEGVTESVEADAAARRANNNNNNNTKPTFH